MNDSGTAGNAPDVREGLKSGGVNVWYKKYSQPYLALHFTSHFRHNWILTTFLSCER